MDCQTRHSLERTGSLWVLYWIKTDLSFVILLNWMTDDGNIYLLLQQHHLSLLEYRRCFTDAVGHMFPIRRSRRWLGLQSAGYLCLAGAPVLFAFKSISLLTAEAHSAIIEGAKWAWVQGVSCSDRMKVPQHLQVGEKFCLDFTAV